MVHLNNSIYWQDGIKDIIELHSVWYTCWGPEKIMTQTCHEPYYPPWNFHCSHGQKECYGNTYLVCADGLFTQDQSMRFAACMLKNQDKIPDIAQECAKAAGIDWSTLNTCYSGDQGKDFMTANAKAAVIIQDAGAQYTPSGWINGKEASPSPTSWTVQDICDAYTGDKPPACK